MECACVRVRLCGDNAKMPRMVRLMNDEKIKIRASVRNGAVYC